MATKPGLSKLDPAWPVARYMADGIFTLTTELEALDDPADPAAMRRLLSLLYRAGRTDLALGRLFEGHVDALQIIHRYGNRNLAGEMVSKARAGATFGVWNAPLPGERLVCRDGRVTGGKAFASGAGLLSHALVTTDPGDKTAVRLWLIDLAAEPPEIDREWWKTIGMARSETHLVRWNGASAVEIGGAGDYEREPWFGGGQLRFVAVQSGGIAAIFDQVRDHLVGRGRADDPYQLGRLGRLFALAESAAATVAAAGDAWFGADDEARVARADAARAGVTAAAEDAIALAQAAVGLQGLFHAHPLSRVLTDLTVYLRQPGPDASLARAGSAAAAGLIEPGL